MTGTVAQYLVDPQSNSVLEFAVGDSRADLSTAGPVVQVFGR